jgi:hypothetical protein
LAKAKRVDLGSLKEGAYGTERMSYIGSRDFNPFAILQFLIINYMQTVAQF